MPGGSSADDGTEVTGRNGGFAYFTGRTTTVWLMKTFFDPSIKGFNYSAGQAGYVEAMTDLGKAWAAFSAIAGALAANPTAPA